MGAQGDEGRLAARSDVQHLSPSEQITPTRPRLRLLNPDTGELLDYDDGRQR